MDELERAKNIIINSGNSFHCKILNYLKGKGWAVLISPYYNDNFSDKPREIDLIAEKAFPVNNRSNYCIGYIDIRLFVECKYIPQLSVFWFHDRDKSKAEELVLSTTSMPTNNIYTKHRYISLDDKVAKLFSGDQQRNAENEPLYKALNQSLNAMVYYRNSPSIILPPHTDRDPICPTLNYPVIACNSFNNCYRVDIDDSTQEPIRINDNFQLEVNYAYTDADKKHKNEYFLIDVIAYEKVDNFLDILQEEVDVMAGFARSPW